MKKEDWQKIEWARRRLGLEERATLREIKKVYRRLSKENHPDVAGHSGKGDQKAMREINRAYQLLLDYCNNYRYPLMRNLNEEVDDEDWWMDRFGQDPLWGKSPGGA